MQDIVLVSVAQVVGDVPEEPVAWEADWEGWGGWRLDMIGLAYFLGLIDWFHFGLMIFGLIGFINVVGVLECSNVRVSELSQCSYIRVNIKQKGKAYPCNFHAHLHGECDIDGGNTTR